MIDPEIGGFEAWVDEWRGVDRGADSAQHAPLSV